LKKVYLFLIFFSFNLVGFSQISVSGCTLNGGMSLGSLCPSGCLAGCNLTAYNFFGTPQCNGTGITGSCASQVISTTFNLPAGCVATGTVEFRVRGVCTSSGADAGDNLTVTGIGGTSTGLPYNVTGASNANLVCTFTKTGGNLTIQLTADRRDEIATWTITLSGTCGPACSSVLPITLSDFYATHTEEGIALKWLVESERDVSHYLIERSNDAENWFSIKQIESISSTAGNSNLIYQALDDAPIKGNNYYRLVTINSDGTKEISKIISVFFQRQSMDDFNISQTEKEVFIHLKNRAIQELIIASIQGAVIKRISTGTNTFFVLPKEEFAAGLYLIWSPNRSKTATKKLVIHK